MQLSLPENGIFIFIVMDYILPSYDKNAAIQRRQFKICFIFYMC